MTTLDIHWFGRSEPNAPTLVLLHGMTDSGLCWPDAIARWSPTYRIAAPDALGHGTSPRLSPAMLAGDPIDAMQQTTLEVLRDVTRDGLNPAVLIGHSMGGGVAASIAGLHPQLLRGVVLEDPAWQDESSRPDLDPVAVRAELARDYRTNRIATLGTAHLMNPTWPESEFEPWADAKLLTDPAFLARGRAALTRPWQQIAMTISVPALVVTGTGGVIIDSAKVTEIQAMRIENTEVSVIPGAGHTVRRDRTDEFHSRVDPWISSLFSML